MAENISKRSIIYEILMDFEQGKKSAKDAEKAIQGISDKTSSLPGVFKAAGTAIGAAFATQQIVAFAREAFELGLKAEGVRAAFKRLNDPTLLNNLRKATRGTVDDLTLMQATVKADKFKIPLNNLAKYFQFATIRARETGQSVNFLVESIIDGIGKKSPQILDNLGLSAKVIGDEFKKTGDFAGAVGGIIERELGASSGASAALISNAEKVEQLRTSWQNFKVELGEFLLTSLGETESAFQKFGNQLAKLFPFLNGMTSGVKDFSDSMAEYNAQTLAAQKATESLINSLKPKPFEDAGISIDVLNTAIEDMTKQLNEADIGSDVFFQMAINIDRATESLDKARLSLAKYIDEFKHGKPALEEVQKIGTDSIESFGKVSSANTDVIKKNVETTKITVADLDAQLDRTAAEQELRIQTIADFSTQTASETFSALSQLATEGSKAQILFTQLQIFANTAQALAAAVAAATESAAKTGGTTLPFLIPAFIGITLSAFAQSNAALSQAKSLSEQMKSFAGGTPYLDDPQAPQGKDTIPVWANRGEAIIPTEENMKAPGLASAWINGDLEDYIKVNYVQPALAVKTIDEIANDSLIDYSNRFYRQLLATAEGNHINKKALKYLSSIDAKINRTIPERYS